MPPHDPYYATVFEVSLWKRVAAKSCCEAGSLLSWHACMRMQQGIHSEVQEAAVALEVRSSTAEQGTATK